MLELVDSTGVLERVVRLTLSSAFQLTQDADGLALLDVNPGAFLTVAAADARYSQLGHTHTFASLTSKPTTIGGYGITDFNTLGDARWSLLAHTHTFASLTSKPATIAGYGITDFNALGDARWAQLATNNVFAGTLSATTLTLTGGGISGFIMQGAPTSNLQVYLGNSSVYGALGTMFSSAYQFLSYNAVLVSSGVDSWTQSVGTNPSGLFEHRPEGIAHYTAVAGKATGNKATFWGVPDFSILGGQAIFTMPSATTPSTPSTYGLRVQTGGANDRVAIGGDTSYGYVQSFGGLPLYLNAAGNPVKVGSGGISTDYHFLADVNYGSGLVGKYDSTKYRLVYAISSSFLPAPDGSSIAGMYGLSFLYDNVSGGHDITTGKNLGHALALVSNGAVGCLMGTGGFWTSGEMWFGATRAAKILWGAGAPTGSAPTGTIYFQTS